MAETEYHYDPKTLQFRRAGFPWLKWVLIGGGFTLMATLAFLGAFRIKNELFSGPAESRLRRENAALIRHQSLLTAELDAASADLQELVEADGELYQQLYMTDKGSSQDAPNPSADILNLKTEEFRKITEGMIKKAAGAEFEARQTSAVFSKLFWPGKSDASDLKRYPTLPPLPDFEPKQVACGFGTQINPFNKRHYKHGGLDILAERGTSVLAAANGRVAEIGTNQGPGGQGNFLVIEHGHGYRTRYAMLESIAVRYGQQVRQGDVIAYIGLSGSSIAPHLHYEVLRNGSPVNPAPFMLQKMDAGALAALFEISKQTKQGLD